MLGINLTNSYIEIFKDFYDGNLRYIGEGLPIERSKRLFEKLFEKYNLTLNKVFLDKEWNEDRIEKIKVISKEKSKMPLKQEREFKNNRNRNTNINNIENDCINRKVDKNKFVRNFLAHMGTEDCITLFCLKNGELYLEYGKEFKDELKRFILSDFTLLYISSKI